jgi:hypothetical protein
MKIEETQPRPRTLGFFSVLGGFLGLVFFWWVPMGILLSICGVIVGLVGWMMNPRRPGAIGLLLGGLVLSLVALGLDVFIARTTQPQASTGVGLSIVRELSKLLGGEVTLQSELGRGSTFTVRLPLQLSEDSRLEFDLAHEGVDLSKAQRVDVRLYAGHQALTAPPAPTRRISPLSSSSPS